MDLSLYATIASQDNKADKDTSKTADKTTKVPGFYFVDNTLRPLITANTTLEMAV